MQTVKCRCAHCRQEFKLKVQDCCSKKCGALYRQVNRKNREPNKKLNNVFDLIGRQL